MNEDLESLITTDMQRIYEMLEDGPTGWGWYSFNARSVMETIDKLPLFFSDRSTIERQFWVLAGLQKLASLAPNPRNTRDIARWCKRQWPAVLGHQPDHVGCLEGFGLAWTLEGRLCTETIKAEERRLGIDWSSNTVDRARLRVEASQHRGMDLDMASNAFECAIDYYQRALEVPQVQTQITGRLLTLVRVLTDILKGGIDTYLEGYFGLHTANTTKQAVAFIGLGCINVDSCNARTYRRAKTHLEEATEIEGYVLPPELQQWYIEYRRVTDPVIPG